MQLTRGARDNIDDSKEQIWFINPLIRYQDSGTTARCLFKACIRAQHTSPSQSFSNQRPFTVGASPASNDITSFDNRSTMSDLLWSVP